MYSDFASQHIVSTAIFFKPSLDKSVSRRIFGLRRCKKDFRNLIGHASGYSDEFSFSMRRTHPHNAAQRAEEFSCVDPVGNVV